MEPNDAGPPNDNRPALAPALYIVGTPIGNLNDITLRALETLRTADVIACEDTRHSQRLLNRHGIRRRLISLHEHNEASRCYQVVALVREEGKSVALVSDAGMPTVSDPGQRLIGACKNAGIAVEVIPGPCAITTALAGSGIPWSGFTFGGFLPNKKEQRRKVLAAAIESGETHVFYESPFRLVKTLAALEEIAPERQLCVCRELTKKFEEFRRGLPSEVRAHYEERKPKGEITLVIAPAKLPKWSSVRV